MLTELIGKLEVLDGPGREVDGLIAKHFGEIPVCARWITENVYGEPDAVWVSGGYGAYEFYDPSPFTESLDAAIALCERVLPGCYREMTGPRKYLNIPTPVPAKFRCEILHDHSSAVAWHDKESIALILATLRALEAQESGR